MATSQNGYFVFMDARTTGALPRMRKWIIPGTDRHLLLRDGSAGFLLAHVALWFHENIDPLSGGIWDEWAWAVRPIRGQTSGYSNHASGTAIDLDATIHPRGVKGTFSKGDKDKMHEQLKVYRGCVRWGEDFTGTVDGMHFEINKPLADVQDVARDRWDSPYGRRVLDANPGAASVIWDGKVPGRVVTKVPRGVDYSYQHPPADAIAAGGYSFVMRYVGSDKAGKAVTAAEVDRLHAAGLGVGFVFEADDKPARAGEGRAAGVADTKRAEAAADALGYPSDCPIFYAVDYDAKPDAVRPYFDGVKATARRPVGVYGSAQIVDAGLAKWRWQTAAWSNGVISPNAHLFQRVGHLGSIPGYTGGWDENDVLGTFPVWNATDPEEDMPLTDDDVAKIVKELRPIIRDEARAAVDRRVGDAVKIPAELRAVWPNTENLEVTLANAVTQLLAQTAPAVVVPPEQPGK